MSLTMTMTRERWLLSAATPLRDLLLDKAGVEFDPEKLRVSCGFPKGARGGKTIGQAWPPTLSEDGTAEVFISPELTEPTRVLDVLLHELIHVAVGNECGHKGPFRKAALAVGLEGKMTATVAGAELQSTLEEMAATLGKYPHAKLKPGANGKQSTRMIKIGCACGVIGRMSRTQIQEMNWTCDTCNEPIEEQG